MRLYPGKWRAQLFSVWVWFNSKSMCCWRACFIMAGGREQPVKWNLVLGCRIPQDSQQLSQLPHHTFLASVNLAALFTEGFRKWSYLIDTPTPTLVWCEWGKGGGVHVRCLTLPSVWEGRGGCLELGAPFSGEEGAHLARWRSNQWHSLHGCNSKAVLVL